MGYRRTLILLLLAACGGDDGVEPDAGSALGWELDLGFGDGGTATVDLPIDGALVFHARAFDFGDRIELVVPLAGGGADDGAICTLSPGGASMGCALLGAVPQPGAVRSGSGFVVAQRSNTGEQVVRYQDGAVDPAFGTAGAVSIDPPEQLRGVAAQPDGSIDVFSSFGADPLDPAPRIRRLDAAGALVTSVDLPIAGSPACADASGEGGLIVVGSGEGNAGFAARLDAQLALDPDFGDGGVAALPVFLIRCAALGDGRTAVTLGMCAIGDCGARILDESGAIDGNAGDGGKVGPEIAPQALAARADGIWFAAGENAQQGPAAGVFDTRGVSLGDVAVQPRSLSVAVGVDLDDRGGLLVAVYQNVLAGQPARLYLSRLTERR